MANTLKDLAATVKLVGQDALERSLQELKQYVDTNVSESTSTAQTAISQVSQKLDTLIGAASGDVDKVLNTFNEIKAFLADYDEDDTLKSLLDAVKAAAATAAATAETNAKSYADGIVGTERTRATSAEGALGTRITTLENVHIMTSAEAKELFDEVFETSAGE